MGGRDCEHFDCSHYIYTHGSKPGGVVLLLFVYFFLLLLFILDTFHLLSILHETEMSGVVYFLLLSKLLS